MIFKTTIRDHFLSCREFIDLNVTGHYRTSVTDVISQFRGSPTTTAVITKDLCISFSWAKLETACIFPETTRSDPTELSIIFEVATVTAHFGIKNASAVPTAQPITWLNIIYTYKGAIPTVAN